MITNGYHKIWRPDFVINCSGIALTLKLVLFCLGRSILFILISIIIDNLLKPVWKLLDKATVALWNPISSKISKIESKLD